MSKRIGYARVMTVDPRMRSQRGRLSEVGCDVILSEYVWGNTREDWPELRKALRALGTGDSLVVTRLDRLACSVRDLANVAQEIDAAGANLVVTARPSTRHRRPAAPSLICWPRSCSLRRTFAANASCGGLSSAKRVAANSIPI